MCNFKLVETSARAPPKHDMFPCWFAPDLAMLMHGKPALGHLKANDTFTICQGYDVPMPKKDP